jgi:hypothetical protein
MGEDYGRYYDALKWHNGIDYQRICDYYGITLHKVVRGDNYCKNNGEESYINSSYYAGGSKPDIFIGIYDDMELEKISFFHELGHYFEKLDRNMCNSYDIEAEAWRIGLEKAKEFNVSFTDNAIKWANDQLETYRVEDKQYKISSVHGLLVDKSNATESYPIRTKEYPDNFYNMVQKYKQYVRFFRIFSGNFQLNPKPRMD